MGKQTHTQACTAVLCAHVYADTNKSQLRVELTTDVHHSLDDLFSPNQQEFKHSFTKAGGIQGLMGAVRLPVTVLKLFHLKR